MKRIAILLLLLPMFAAAQDTQQEPEATVTSEAVTVKKIHHVQPADSIYLTALEAYNKGDYYTSHYYAAKALSNAAKMNRKLAANMYAMAIKSSYASGHYSSAIVYYESMRRARYPYNDTLTRMAIFCFYPVKSLQRQEDYNIDLKDTAFVLRIVNEMVKKDPRWLAIRAKVYNSIYGNDTLPEEVQEAYKMKMDDDLTSYAAEFSADDWKEILL
jgi:hypothetical protein